MKFWARILGSVFFACLFFGTSQTILQAQGTAAVSTKYSCTLAPYPGDKALLNIASWNLGHGQEAGKAAKVAEYFQYYDVDVIALQELYDYENDPTRDVVKDIPIEFAKRFPGQTFYYAHYWQKTDHALMVVSKFPITETRAIDIPGDRGNLLTKLDTPYGPLRIYNTHLQTKSNAMCGGLHVGLEFVKKTGGESTPFMLIGDYNLRYGPAFGCTDLAKQMLANNCEAAELGSENCNMRQGVDFLLPGKNIGPPLQYVCRKPHFLYDSHELYLSTVKMPGPPPTPTPAPTPTPTPIPLVKSCSVQVSATQVEQNSPVVIQLQASTTRATDEPVKLFLTRADNTSINPIIPNTTERAYEGKYYYLLTPDTCQTSGSRTCNTAVQISQIPAGTYKVFCDMSQQPNSCNGNPNCRANGGTIDCETLGFGSCSSSDFATFTVAGKPGDVNKDGKVDIFDYNKIIEFFGQDKCEYNLVETCRIDIFDFNMILSHLGES